MEILKSCFYCFSSLILWLVIFDCMMDIIFRKLCVEIFWSLRWRFMPLEKVLVYFCWPSEKIIIWDYFSLFLGLEFFSGWPKWLKARLHSLQKLVYFCFAQSIEDLLEHLSFDGLWISTFEFINYKMLSLSDTSLAVTNLVKSDPKCWSTSLHFMFFQMFFSYCLLLLWYSEEFFLK